jgi:hypothetical protein
MSATIKMSDDDSPDFEIVLSGDATADEKSLRDRFELLRAELSQRKNKPEYMALLQRLQSAARLGLAGVNGASPQPQPALVSFGAIHADYDRLKARVGRFKVSLPGGDRPPSPRDIVFAFDNVDKTDPVPADQLKLKADIEDTLTTLQIIFAEPERRNRKGCRLFGAADDDHSAFARRSAVATVEATLVTLPADGNSPAPVAVAAGANGTAQPQPPAPLIGSTASSRNQRRFDEYQFKLKALAQVGLQDNASPDTARLALTALQDEILRREGPRIKNAYMSRLGAWALIFGGAAVIVYLILHNNDGFSRQFSSLLNLALVWAGTMVGTWLSFGLRKPVIALSDLNSLESDMVEPPLRLIFTGLIALTISFIFLTGMVNVAIGTLKSAELLVHGSTALVIGLLLGVSEQALPGALTRRASQFVSEVAGK